MRRLLCEIPAFACVLTLDPEVDYAMPVKDNRRGAAAPLHWTASGKTWLAYRGV